MKMKTETKRQKVLAMLVAIIDVFVVEDVEPYRQTGLLITNLIATAVDSTVLGKMMENFQLTNRT